MSGLLRSADARPVALIGALAALALVLAGVGQALVGGSEPPAVAASNLRPAPEALSFGRADDALVQAESRVSAMIDRLAERLKAQPGDADGWQTLARSYASLGRHAAAIEAFRRALRLRPDEATLLAEYAFCVAVLDPHAASGEPARLVTRALQIDPANPKALALAGTLALDRRDYEGAIAHWEQLARIEPADSAAAKQLQLSILQARQLAGAPGRAMPVAALGPTAPPTSTSVQGPLR